MKFEPRFNKKDIERQLNKYIETIDRRLIDRLQYLGEMCVKHAREIPKESGFEDQTGNLRSSIGYMIFKNGMAIRENYEVVKEGAEGMAKGKALAREVADKNPRGLLLVVTAGMEYASVVESRGRDVLTSAEDLAARELPEMLRKLKANIEKSFMN